MECNKKVAAIIHATLELVSENGFHGCPMAMVAERAGVAAGTIYRYFDSKEALINATQRHLEERLLKKAMEEYPETGNAQEKFQHVAKVLVKEWISSPLVFRFLEQFYNSPYALKVRQEKLLGNAQDLCRDIFLEALDHKLVKELPIAMLFALAFGPLIYICRDHNLGFFQLDESMLEQAIDGCWSAVKR